MTLPALMNLEKVRVLIVDNNAQALEIMASVLTGFGVREIVRAKNAAEAKAEILSGPVDLILTDAYMPDVTGYELIAWLRRRKDPEVRTIPMILVTPHTPRRHVERARDCGAHYMIAKPISPHVLLERIAWVARSGRFFVECDVYVGPDRRWKHAGPPVDAPDGRRRDDQPSAIGDASSDNLSQEELDRIIKPQKSAA